jgi:hypothetical protein
MNGTSIKVEELEYALRMNPNMPTVFSEIQEKITGLEIAQNSLESKVRLTIEAFRNDKSTTEFEVKVIKGNVE